ncbi:Response regulator receiver domain-containing protein [Quadrisphaera granulorum]|uniref:Response regulator receiver domain-containing protein n=1 Tax=Quadrisphaera granulorum TaxID=317664 RepID=A0A316AE63_9ACTN|nr:response regulator [Quadrisphaera granulorum]PWJ55649.1 response regulator receiver domain-containing protein [Quadrisphaera granulorum]SZE95146.1 Response regulator receiver domain-containing protein [Quadrisphaera granulorum]
MKILIADDSRVMRQIVIRTLRQAGFDDHEVIEAENGRDAFEKVSSEAPDLLLSDWNMPEMTGIECLRALRASGADVPFGFVTSEGSEEMRSAAAAAGALFLIAKPFSADTFEAALGPVLGGGSASAELEHVTTTGTGATQLPVAKDARDMLEGLLNKECTFADGNRPSGNVGVVGTYVDSTTKLRAVVAFDLPMAAYIGAAIGLLPPGAAADAVDDKELFPNLRTNAAEVLNVMAALFNVGDAAHLKLYSHHALGEQIPTDVIGHLTALGGRVDWAVSVKGYGTGTLSIVLV